MRWATEGLVDRPYARSTPEVYEVFDDAPGRGFTFVAENFRRVETGEVFAEKDGTVRWAETDFYPVLMSTHGYDDRIGFKARRAGRVEEV